MLQDEFQSAGYGVFGLHPIVDGKCGCGNPECAAPGKHPVISGWQHTPRDGWSDEQFDMMGQVGHFSTGYGVSCKKLIVVDVDARNGGVESFERLLEKIPDLETSAGLVVWTGSGGGSKHIYFQAPEDKALLSHLRDYPGVDFRSGNSFVVGPGSLHISGARYHVEDGDPDSIGEAPAGLVAMLERPATVRVEYDGKVADLSHKDVASMVKAIPNNDLDYDTWINIGMANHHCTAASGFDIWDRWSQTSAKYDAEKMAYWWNHFGKHPNPVTAGTLFHYAEQNGWVRPVTDEDIEIDNNDDTDLPCDIAGVDIRKPPGFVGEVTDWFASLPRRKRDNLAVGAALTTVGNHIGLRFQDEHRGATGNLIAFGVAGSGTGKEAILQGFFEIHRETGISGAVHGAIKSDAEIYRNLIRNQAAFYNMDEISDFLEKLNSAKKKGGAAYLETVIGTLMSVFTKADGYVGITGDAKAEMKEDLQKQAAREQRKLDDGNGSEVVLARTLAQLDEIDKGIKHPFLSLCGYGTPEKFHDLMDFRSATEGFFARAMVFEEKDPAPRIRKDYRKVPLPEHIKDTLTQLYYGPDYDMTERRVQYTGERKKVPTDAAATELMDKISDWADDKAIEESSKTGLHPLYLRGAELVGKVSFILAAPGGVRTYEHVRWAFALVMHNLELKKNLVTANDRKLDSPGEALQAKITAILDKQEWITEGVINNKCRGYTKDDILNMLKKMVESGVVKGKKDKHPRNGKEIRKYLLTQ